MLCVEIVKVVFGSFDRSDSERNEDYSAKPNESAISLNRIRGENGLFVGAFLLWCKLY